MPVQSTRLCGVRWRAGAVRCKIDAVTFHHRSQLEAAALPPVRLRHRGSDSSQILILFIFCEAVTLGDLFSVLVRENNLKVIKFD